MNDPKEPFPPRNLPTARWYRRNGWITAMVAGTLFVGPLMALPVLLILCTGPVFSGRDMKPWDLSTKALVLTFSFAVMVVWIIRVVALFGRPN